MVPICTKSTPFVIGESAKLTDFIEAIEDSMGHKAEKELMPMQPGDVERTWADVDELIRDYDYQPNTSVADGVQNFVDWYKAYYKKQKPNN